MVPGVLLIVAGFGMGAAALTGYPLYLGLIAGWLYLSVVFMAALLPDIVMDKLDSITSADSLHTASQDGRNDSVNGRLRHIELTASPTTTVRAHMYHCRP